MSAGRLVDKRKQHPRKSYSPSEQHVPLLITPPTAEQEQAARDLIRSMAGDDADTFMQMLGLTTEATA
jgi:hypothetical protein